MRHHRPIEALEPRRLFYATTPFDPEPVTADTGASFTTVLDRMPAVNPQSLSQMHGQITWGDGHTTKAALTGGDLAQGVFTVTGTHRYARPGTRTATTVVYSKVVGSKLKPAVAFEIVTAIDAVKMLRT